MRSPEEIDDGSDAGLSSSSMSSENTPNPSSRGGAWARSPVPVIPMALQGMWGSFFSRKGGAAMSQKPRRFWSRVTLVIGAPIPPEGVTAAVLQERVQELLSSKQG